jgi:uncharacterized protein (DUF2062 family)
MSTLHRKIRELWDRARREHSTPREIGWSVGVGAFVACTPLLGLHLWVALALATVFRLNRLWTVVGSRLSSTPILLATTFCEIEAAHRVRTGRWAPIVWHEALAHGRELLGDWIAGAAVVGGLIAACAGFLAYAVARRLQTARPARPHTPGRLPRPSSGSPPSKPPQPIR